MRSVSADRAVTPFGRSSHPFFWQLLLRQTSSKNTDAMKMKPSDGKAASHRPSKKVASAQPSINTRTHPDAAGIDVGAGEFVVAVPPGRCEETVRTYNSFTSGVHALRDWLLECGIKTAAMESTGNYWITLYDVLTAAGIEVYLVNARHVKGVPGKKTDVCDAQWLQQLHAAGLLRKSFRPALGIVPLRFLMRHRAEMVGDAAKQLQLMQKSLTEMNLKLQHVFSDIDGMSAQAIIEAILAGERDPKKLAALRDKRCRSSAGEIIEALRGDYREEYLFVLAQSQRIYRQLREAIAACDEKLGELAARVECEVSAPLPEAPKGQRNAAKTVRGSRYLKPPGGFTEWIWAGCRASRPGCSAHSSARLARESNCWKPSRPRSGLPRGWVCARTTGSVAAKCSKPRRAR